MCIVLLCFLLIGSLLGWKRGRGDLFELFEMHISGSCPYNKCLCFCLFLFQCIFFRLCLPIFGFVFFFFVVFLFCFFFFFFFFLFLFFFFGGGGTIVRMPNTMHYINVYVCCCFDFNIPHSLKDASKESEEAPPGLHYL